MLRQFNFFKTRETQILASENSEAFKSLTNQRARSNVFPEKPNVENGVDEKRDTAQVDLLQNLPEICAVSDIGSSFVVLGDAGGGLSLINRSIYLAGYKKAHQSQVNLLYSLKTKPVLVSLGDGPSKDSRASVSVLDSQIKFWSVEASFVEIDGRRMERGSLSLLHSFRLGDELAKGKNTPYWVGDTSPDRGMHDELRPWITCLAVSEDVSQIALGYSNGQVIVIRSLPSSNSAVGSEISDLFISKDRVYSTLQSFKHVGKSTVTGLGFTKSVEDDSTWLWVSTDKSLRSYRTKSRSGNLHRLGEIEVGPELDKEGCKAGCGTVTASPYSTRPTMRSSSATFSSNQPNPNAKNGTVGQPLAALPSHIPYSSTRQDFFVLAKSDRIEYYGPSDPGNVYAVSGEKKRIFSFCNYLVVVSEVPNLAPVTGDDSTDPSVNDVFELVKLYDFRNKIVALCLSLRKKLDGGVYGSDHVKFIASQWGQLLIFTLANKVIILKEKDRQSKLDDLFQRNLFPTAISLAQSSGCSETQVMKIFKMYGDHLYAKGNYEDAATHYCRTIGYLEPSYVIGRFLDSQHIEYLTTYLETLHLSTNLVNLKGSHTALLLNCYIKQKNEKKLKDFVEDTAIMQAIDVEAAVEALCTAHYLHEALLLARKHHLHSLVLSILLDEQGEYDQALLYMREMTNTEAEFQIKKYGKMLMNARPDETTDFIEDLCCKPEVWKKSVVDNYEKQDNLVDASETDGLIKPEDFIKTFVDHSKNLLRFLRRIVQTNGMRPHSSLSPLVWNTYLELVIRETENIADEKSRAVAEKTALDVLQSPQANYDLHHALVLVQKYDLRKGKLFLYEKLHMYHMVLQFYMEEGDTAAILAKCKALGTSDPSLWIQVLSYFARKSDGDDCGTDIIEAEIREILSQTDLLRVVPPLTVVEILSSNPNIKLSTVLPYVLSHLRNSQRLIDEHRKAIAHLKEDTARMRTEIEELSTQPKVFKSTKCNLTGAPLELPTVHFLSGNSYNLSSLPGSGSAKDALYSSSTRSSGKTFENMLLEDPKCGAEQQSVLEIMSKLRQNAATVDEEFFNQMEISNDGFSTVAEYFSKCLFE